ncbi:hypothetical protein RHSIM_Rhsim04G0053400 [Rhododendron simsii]|uniref:CCHC-type domain-containing protein n=1 Tax=Rhododendron simsii TaxID=118357 RepID=A0A834LS21_RHOSS|nr:hypothetical protein RHSIM_Rhsim04G0053400 [Rhododendron simsii]
MVDPDYLDLEEGSGETGELSNLCLVGKVVNQKTLNVTAVTNILNSAWKTRAPFSVVPWNYNVFLFRFQEDEDRTTVLKDGPWSVMSSLLILTPLVEGMVVSDLHFSHCPFWVQVHGLPVEKMSRANAEIIGRRFGKLLALETSPDNMLLARSFLRVRVDINLAQPLPKGFWLRRKNGNRDLWISYKYENLPDYCYACGRIGHDNRSCKMVNREEGLNFGYGPELRTSRARRAPIPIEEIRQEVDEAEIRVENLLQRRPESLEDYGAVRDGTEVMGRVSFPNPQQILSAAEETLVPHSMPDVNIPRMEGMIPSSPSSSDSLGGPNSGSVVGSLVFSCHKPGHAVEVPLPHIKINPTYSPFPSPIPTSPHYFVTEPPESPRATSHANSPKSPNPIFDPFLNSSLQPCSPNIPHSIENSSSPSLPYSHPPSPSLQPPTQSLTIENCLTSVFKSLAIKRKADEDFPEDPRPKILRLCAPNPKPTHQQPKSSRQTRKYVKKSCNLLSLPKGEGGSGLCEVQVTQSNFDGEDEKAMVPVEVVALEAMEKVLEFGTGDEKGLVAGPKQPLPQC